MKTFQFFILSLLIGLISCQEKPFIQIPENSELIGLASPVRLNPGQTLIYLEDFFPKTELIDSISLPSYLTGNMSSDKKTLTLSEPEKDAPFLMELKIWVKGFPYAVLLKKSNKIRHPYTFDPGKNNYQEVRLKGEMNSWNPSNTILTQNDGLWETEFLIPPGNYQYILLLDGKETLDFNNPDSANNNIGGFNSLMRVGKPGEGNPPQLSTISHEESNFTIEIENSATGFHVFWENSSLPEESYFLEKNMLTVAIPFVARKTDRSFFRIWAENEDGISNDLLIPVNKGFIVDNSDQLNREDWESSVFYFLMVDRFNNGNEANDKKVDDPEVLPKVNYFGGDLAGVTKKIKDGFFKDLGINTIWLSPITQNPWGAYGQWNDPKTKFSGYHGYWPVSSSKVDERFGTSEELEELIQTAHLQDMNVILDYVANHVHELHPVYRNHPDWATSLYLPDGTMNTEKWDEYRLTTWFDTFLPTLDLENPLVTETMSDSALYWLKHYDFDGFRHDATKHIPEIFWRTLTKKIKEQVSVPKNKRIYQIGETYGDRALIGSYVNTGMLDAQFDFNVYDNEVGAFARDEEPLSNLANSLSESLKYYGNHNLMGYISGNQDKARFISLAGEDVRFDENQKMAGWQRDIGVGNPVSYKKLLSLLAFNLTIPGIPTIYYGDEFGMPGANDPDNRRQMKFGGLSDKEQENRIITQKLINLRRTNLALIYGDIKILNIEDQNLAFIRSYFQKAVVVVFNKSNEEAKVIVDIPQRFDLTSFKSNFGSDLKVDGQKIIITLAPHTFEILNN